jgi:DNA-directed RNA polymerase subunit RPC12/RpoP
MLPYTSILPTVSMIAVVALFLVWGLAEQGKKLRCPSCSRVFDAPFADRKLFSLGFTFPHFGKVVCPKCGAKRLRRSYAEV